MRPIVVASDHAGFGLKEKVKVYLVDAGYKVKDMGTYSSERCDYPDYAAALARGISEKKYDLGIVICYSGIGVSIVANKFPRVRAALCYNERAARLSREHNKSNVLALGAGFTTVGKVKKIIDAWLNAAFQGGRHARRLNKMRGIEQRIKDDEKSSKRKKR